MIELLYFQDEEKKDDDAIWNVYAIRFFLSTIIISR